MPRSEVATHEPRRQRDLEEAAAEIERLRTHASDQGDSAIRAWCALEAVARAMGVDPRSGVDELIAAAGSMQKRVAELEKTVSDEAERQLPLYDTTDFAHPVWRRGADHATDMMQARVDRAEARVTELEADLIHERAIAGHVLFSKREALRREGAEAMRERAAEKLKRLSDDIVTQSEEFRTRGNAKVADRLLAEARAVAATSVAIRDLPLDDKAALGGEAEAGENPWQPFFDRMDANARPSDAALPWHIGGEPFVPPPPPFDLLAYIHRHREWSESTLGPGARTSGVLAHIRKELEEIAADPSDVEEWDGLEAMREELNETRRARDELAKALNAERTRSEMMEAAIDKTRAELADAIRAARADAPRGFDA